MTYSGAKAKIPVKVIIVTGTNAFKNASLIMTFQKICNYLSILTTVLTLSIIGGGFFTYKYLTSEQFKNKMLNEIMGSVNKVMPKMINEKLPSQTLPHVPLPYKLK